MVNWTLVEPVGVDDCTVCGSNRELLAEDGKKEESSICPKCMTQKFGDEFLTEWVIGAGVVAEPDCYEDVVIFNYGYGITVEFDLKQTDMPASRHPDETDSIRFQKTQSNTATIRFGGEELGSVRAPKWASYADDYLYPE